MINTKNGKIIDLIICLVITSIVFIPTLNRPWLFYDENILFTGSYFPTAKNLNNFFEIIRELGLNFNIISSNAIYTSNQVIRTAPFGQIFGMIISSLFKKDPFYYHLFNFSLHLINTSLVFLIINYFINSTNNSNKRVLTILLTSIWSTHPVMIEPILLSINCGATFSYIFFFSFILDILKNKNNIPRFRFLTIPILFLIPMLTNEYIIMIPFIILLILLYLEEPLGKALIKSSPYFIGLFLYIIYYFFISNFSTKSDSSSLNLLLERVLWLSPQLFFHDLKLIFYPHILSIDQSVFVKLANNLLDPYAISCFLFLLTFILFPVISFFIFKKNKNIFLMFMGFFISLIPFLHILVPSYALSCERYLYTPLFFIILGIGLFYRNVIPYKQDFRKSSRKVATLATPRGQGKLRQTFLFKYCGRPDKDIACIAFTTIILILCMGRSHIRSLDWKDTYTFINSSYKTSTDPFFQAIRLGMLGKVMSVFNPEETGKIKDYFIQTLDLLEKAKIKTEKNKKLYQDNIPEILKNYGLDYENKLRKITFLEVSSKCIELNQDQKIGIKLLEPFFTKNQKTDTNITELYAYLLIKDKNISKAKNVLEQALTYFPNDTSILNKLFDIAILENDVEKAEIILKKELKLFSYDPNILLKAVRFYTFTKNKRESEKYIYLYKLRTGL